VKQGKTSAKLAGRSSAKTKTAAAKTKAAKVKAVKAKATAKKRAGSKRAALNVSKMKTTAHPAISAGQGQ
jgi:hypothetical protein